MPQRAKVDRCQYRSRSECVEVDPSDFSGVQRKVFTTPVRNEADDVSVTNIIPKVRGLNKERGCAAASIGEKRHQSQRMFMAKWFSK